MTEPVNDRERPSREDENSGGIVGRILIADDEETFLFATADLLRREGYACDCAPDAKTASRLLAEKHYDLLISDIKMPGNAKLEFINELPGLAKGLPVILVTGYPTLDSAIQSIQLPVTAYMTKPIDLEQLLKHIRASVEKFQVYGAVQRLKKRVASWNNDLLNLEHLFGQTQTGVASLVRRDVASKSSTVDIYLDLTFQNLVDTLQDVKHLTSSVAAGQKSEDVCHLLNCPKLTILSDALKETIAVLEKTKGSFKSKSLGDLRKKLVALMEEKEAD